MISAIGSFTGLFRTMLISVVIPTCNRNDLLAKCLDCLAPGRQGGGEIAGLKSEFCSPPPAFTYEVIVTDDGSKTTAQELIQSSYPWAVWVRGPRTGPAANRNNGAKNAKGEWLIFLDDDCLPDPFWLDAIWTPASKRILDVIEGKTVTPDKVDNPFRQGVENLTGDNYWSCNLAIRRETFFSIGAFDEDFLEAGGEDMELAFRIRKHNLHVLFDLVYFPGPLDAVVSN
jgi:glycosyltransferase involved in cell wall biosynthesis